jgi:general secretion pathway protein G
VGLAGLLDPWGNAYQYLNFADIMGVGQVRKDRNLVPINTDFDLYSMGRDGASQPPLTANTSRDDIVRANDGRFVGKAEDY